MGIDNCNGLLPLVRVIRRGVIPIFQIGIPILLIILGMFDLGKAVISNEEKEVKAAQSRLIKRFIYAALVFFVVTLVTALMSIVAEGGAKDTDTTNWKNCWDSAA